MRPLSAFKDLFREDSLRSSTRSVVSMSSEGRREVSRPNNRVAGNRDSKGRKPFRGGAKRSSGADGNKVSRSSPGTGAKRTGGSAGRPHKSETRIDRPIRKPRIEPLIPEDIEAKMLPGKVRAELLSLSAENSEVVAKQMVMIDRLLSSNDEADRNLANQFGKAASERAGRVGIVRQYAGRASLSVGDFAEAKKHFSAAFRINGNPMMKVFLAECETGLGKARKSLDLLGEIALGSLTPRDAAYAHLVSAEARVALGQLDAALITMSRKYEEILTRLSSEESSLLLRWISLKEHITSQL
jgi:hypothetical protein